MCAVIRLFLLRSSPLARRLILLCHCAYSYLPPKTQVVLVSATMPKDVLEVVRWASLFPCSLALFGLCSPPALPCSNVGRYGLVSRFLV